MTKAPPATPALLIGAGLSPGQPTAADLMRPLLKLFAPEALPDIENIRFELFMQLIKDHLDPDLSFITDLYGTPPETAHRYSELIAALISNNNFTVFTTNFDRNIERANAQALCAAATSAPVAAIATKQQFSDWLINPIEHALFKLHGSVENPPSLAATYESVTWLGRPADPRAKIFEHTIATQDLWVLGYSGHDDMDVVPTIVNTPATGRRIFWFYHTMHKSGYCSGTDFLEMHDEIDPKISQSRLPILNIIKAIALAGTRSISEDFFVVYGNTEQMLLMHLEQLRISTAPQSACSSHAIVHKPKPRQKDNNEHADDPLAIARKLLADNVTRAWFKKKAPLVYANAVHTINYDRETAEALVKLIEALKVDLRSSTSADAHAALISANASLVQLYYWLEHEADEIYELRDECIALLTRLLNAQTPQSTTAPERITQNIVSVLLWVAEKERFDERFESARLALAHPHLINPEELSYQITAHSRYDATHSQYLLELLVARTNGERTLTQADLFHATENFLLAEKCYITALQCFDKVGDSYWRIYALDGIASTYWARGDLASAERFIAKAKIANSLSGYTSWNDKHPTIKDVDISCIRGACCSSTAAQLEAFSEAGDESEKKTPDSESILIDWVRLRAHLEHSVTNDLADIEALGDELIRLACSRGLGPINRLKAIALMSEHLVNHVSLDIASAALRNLLRQSRDARMPVTKLKLWLQLALLRLKFGQARPRRYLVRYCERHGFCLGAGWATALTGLSGHEVSSNDRLRWVGWAEDQALPDLCAAFDPDIDKAAFVTQLRLRMPFGYH